MGSWMIRKCSLAKGVISAKISLAKDIRIYRRSYIKLSLKMRFNNIVREDKCQHDLINIQRTIKHWIMTAVNDHHNHVFGVTHTIYYQLLVLALVYTCAWWRHQIETYSALLALCVGNSPVTGEFPSQRPVTQSFDFFICAWINGWVNNREAGDLRRNRAHYDVVVMVNLLFTYGMSYQITIDIVLLHNCCIRCVCVCENKIELSELSENIR